MASGLGARGTTLPTPSGLQGRRATIGPIGAFAGAVARLFSALHDLGSLATTAGSRWPIRGVLNAVAVIVAAPMVLLARVFDRGARAEMA